MSKENIYKFPLEKKDRFSYIMNPTIIRYVDFIISSKYSRYPTKTNNRAFIRLINLCHTIEYDHSKIVY
jgi:hypothetical protein